MLFSHMLHSLDFSLVSGTTYDYDLLIQGLFFNLQEFERLFKRFYFVYTALAVVQSSMTWYFMQTLGLMAGSSF